MFLAVYTESDGKLNRGLARGYSFVYHMIDFILAEKAFNVASSLDLLLLLQHESPINIGAHVCVCVCVGGGVVCELE